MIGGRTRIKVVKNKVAAPFKQTEVDLIYNEFKKLGIEIPFPQRVVQMKSDSNSDTSPPAKRDGTDLPPPFNRE